MTKVTLSVNEVAELIGVSTASIYTMAREGQIPHRRVRARILFHKESIEIWLQGDAPKQKEA